MDAFARGFARQQGSGWRWEDGTPWWERLGKGMALMAVAPLWALAELWMLLDALPSALGDAVGVGWGCMFASVRIARGIGSAVSRLARAVWNGGAAADNGQVLEFALSRWDAHVHGRRDAEGGELPMPRVAEAARELFAELVRVGHEGAAVRVMREHLEGGAPHREALKDLLQCSDWLLTEDGEVGEAGDRGLLMNRGGGTTLVLTRSSGGAVDVEWVYSKLEGEGAARFVGKAAVSTYDDVSVELWVRIEVTVAVVLEGCDEGTVSVTGKAFVTSKHPVAELSRPGVESHRSHRFGFVARATDPGAVNHVVDVLVRNTIPLNERDSSEGEEYDVANDEFGILDRCEYGGGYDDDDGDGGDDHDHPGGGGSDDDHRGDDDLLDFDAWRNAADNGHCDDEEDDSDGGWGDDYAADDYGNVSYGGEQYEYQWGHESWRDD